ncbi:alpha-D-ribose 1-methylphosphonate 5-triphosphate diphosphatase [Maritalea mobilis]|uniref:alpha-D-ribose 1-methylphosphonate 5-triphosphate diphosphatase n=1 Tax=Maritalea mobilis TaxID=483324 RepID=UPI001C96B0CD|nr:alpha-D-ribose 1-methylphosphonate 5-triphosphate diphosphatase [Maritalea mobilis]MBY6201187.1 alpha-D-ribose 1-methylphosphonate 5-triphosphate diphosphatase [Maritalea mobilis]
MTRPCLTFENAQVLMPDGVATGALSMSDGWITEALQPRRIDLSGYLILPGIVDLHGDGFERHVAPRRGLVGDLGPGLRGLEAELAANGITTAVLAQYWSWEGGMRAPDFAKRLADALRVHPARADLIYQLRLELGCMRETDEVLAFIDQHTIPFVVFNDHLPHEALASGKRPPSLQGQALKSGRSPEEHRVLMQSMHEALPEIRAKLPAFCAELARRGIRMGSHDDMTAEERAAWREMGALIAEFPMARPPAEAGDPVILGAPNVVRGGSHKKKSVSALELVQDGLCDALCSDYYYPAPFTAARKLVSLGWSLPEAWALVSANPATMIGLTDRGRLAPGARADLLVTDPDLSQVYATIAGGQVTWLAGDLAARMIA